MSVTLRQTEDVPPASGWPSITLPDQTTVDVPHLWQRLEHYVDHRWQARDVTWIVEGPGDWTPPLAPATVSTTELWSDGAWEAVTLEPTPLGGLVLPAEATYRVAASVGAGPVPEAVTEALVRLHEYLRDRQRSAGHTSHRFQIGDMHEEVEHRGDAFARALQYSGAADLLRPWRRPR